MGRNYQIIKEFIHCHITGPVWTPTVPPTESVGPTTFPVHWHFIRIGNPKSHSKQSSCRTTAYTCRSKQLVRTGNIVQVVCPKQQNPWFSSAILWQFQEYSLRLKPLVKRIYILIKSELYIYESIFNCTTASEKLYHRNKLMIGSTTRRELSGTKSILVHYRVQELEPTRFSKLFCFFDRQLPSFTHIIFRSMHLLS